MHIENERTMTMTSVDQVVAFDLLRQPPKIIIVTEETGRQSVDAVQIDVHPLRQRLIELGMGELAVRRSCDGLQQIGGLVYHSPGGKSKTHIYEGPSKQWLKQ